MTEVTTTIPKATPAAALRLTALVSILYGDVLASGDNKPAEKGKEENHKKYYVKVRWEGIEVVDGEAIHTTEVVRMTSHVLVPKGFQTLLVSVFKVDFNTYYTVHAVVDEKQTVGQFLKTVGGAK